MAYYQQPGAYAPPPNQPPQPGYYPPPPQSYSPNPAMYNQQQPSYPPQQWQAPPGQGQWNQQPQYNQPPPQQWQQQQYNPSHAPPGQQQGGWGGPLPPGQYQPPPQQGQYGAQQTPASQYGEPTAQRGADPRSDAIRIHKAIDRLGTNDKELVLTLCAVQNPGQMTYLKQTYDSMYGHERTLTGQRKDFISAIKGDTSGSYGEACAALARSPAEQDAYAVNKAIKGAGTDEELLNDVLIGRTNAELGAMRHEYQRMFGRPMAQDVAEDLSMKTRDMFMTILDERQLREEEYAPCHPQQVQQWASDLKRAMPSGLLGGVTKDTSTVTHILSKRSNGQIRAINQAYKGSLEKDIKDKFSGHMERAFLLMLYRGVDPIKADADQLEFAMKGVGTKDDLLVNRTVQIHWNRDQANGVRHAYNQYNRKPLIRRIQGDTSGWYRDILVEMMYPGELEGRRGENEPP